MNCGRETSEWVRYCPPCIEEETLEINEMRIKQGKDPYMDLENSQ